MRELIRTLGREGRTVFVSSHVLSEIQQTCDRVAILSRGRAVKIGSVDEVLTRGQGTSMLVRVPDAERSAEVLRGEGMDVQVVEGALHVEVGETSASRVTEVLASNGIYLSELRPHEMSLEDVFLELTNEQGNQVP